MFWLQASFIAKFFFMAIVLRAWDNILRLHPSHCHSWLTTTRTITTTTTKTNTTTTKKKNNFFLQPHLLIYFFFIFLTENILILNTISRGFYNSILFHLFHNFLKIWGCYWSSPSKYLMWNSDCHVVAFWYIIYRLNWLIVPQSCNCIKVKKLYFLLNVPDLKEVGKFSLKMLLYAIAPNILFPTKALFMECFCSFSSLVFQKLSLKRITCSNFCFF